MKIRTDYLLHFETSALIALAFGLFLPWWVAALIALCAGIGKELWDKYHDGCPSWGDIAWDAAGVLAGVGLVLLKHLT